MLNRSVVCNDAAPAKKSVVTPKRRAVFTVFPSVNIKRLCICTSAEIVSAVSSDCDCLAMSYCARSVIIRH